MASAFRKFGNAASAATKAFSGAFVVAGRSADDLWSATTSLSTRAKWNRTTRDVYDALAGRMDELEIFEKIDIVDVPNLPDSTQMTAMKTMVVGKDLRAGRLESAERLANDLVSDEYVPRDAIDVTNKQPFLDELDKFDQDVGTQLDIEKIPDSGAYLLKAKGGGNGAPEWFQNINGGDPVIAMRIDDTGVRLMSTMKKSEGATNVVKGLISNNPHAVHKLYTILDNMDVEDRLDRFNDAIDQLARRDNVTSEAIRLKFDYKEFLATGGKGYLRGGGTLRRDVLTGRLLKQPRIRPNGKRWKESTPPAIVEARVEAIWKDPRVGMSMCRRSNVCADLASFLTVAGLTTAAAVLAVNARTCGKATIVPGACDDAGDKDAKDDDWGARFNAAMSAENSQACFANCMPTTWDDRTPELYAAPPKYRTFESVTARILAERCGAEDGCGKDAYERLLDKGDDGYLGMQPFCSSEHDEPLGECREYCLAQCANTPVSYKQLHDELVREADARDVHNATQIGLIVLGVVALAAILAYFFLSGKKSDEAYEEELWGDMRDES